MADTSNTIAFQGWPGAYSDLACRTVFPDLETLPCPSFEDAFAATRDGKAGLAMIPIENTVAGRVADIHHLIPESGLHIIGEHFQKVNHHLLALPGTNIDDITHVHSHIHALNQCRILIRELGIEPVIHADTAGAAKQVAEGGDKTQAAIGSELAGEIDGLASLQANIEDAAHNTTRFLIMARDAKVPQQGEPCMTTFIFRVRNVPAALYKAMGGFATNGINMTKLESYLAEGQFYAAQFYADVEGHPEDTAMKHAFDELHFFCDHILTLGTYPRHPFRDNF